MSFEWCQKPTAGPTFSPQGCQRVVEDWQKILQVRSLVLSPQEDMRPWLKFASLCRKSGRLALSHKTLVRLLGCDPSLSPSQPLPVSHPHVTYQYCKHIYTYPHRRQEAYWWERARNVDSLSIGFYWMLFSLTGWVIFSIFFSVFFFFLVDFCGWLYSVFLFKMAIFFF